MVIFGSSIAQVTLADGNTYTVAGNEEEYQYDSTNQGCNLDEANGRK